MILSTSSSRAVSMRIGTSDRCRTRRQTSMPSRSGSIRSRTMRDGASAAAWSIPSSPDPATRTLKPARLRYMATKEAILGSSSTTRIEWFGGRCTAPHGDTDTGGFARGSAAELEGAPRPGPGVLVPAGDRIATGGPGVDAVERQGAPHDAADVDAATAQTHDPRAVT